MAVGHAHRYLAEVGCAPASTAYCNGITMVGTNVVASTAFCAALSGGWFWSATGLHAAGPHRGDTTECDRFACAAVASWRNRP